MGFWSRVTETLDARLYPGVGDNWDDEELRARVLRVLAPDHHLLDVGAGAGIVPQMNFRGHAARVCGVDLDPRVMDNPFLDEARLSGAERIPYGDATFDVVVSDNVLEHLAEPATVFAEVARVLKPGGSFFAKTPNRAHYMPTIARVSPHAVHQAVNRFRGRASADTFPTLYRANRPRRIHALAASAGLEVVDIALVERRPEYLRKVPPAYLLGWLYERTVNATELLADLRILLVVQLRKATSSRRDQKT
jgi:2-polyprenyl-3-methyl-5-hydroxy-6-metoxy-1,4-benzoquinol methylase